MSESEEYAKAIAEVAKCGTKALDSGDKFGGFLSKVFGVPIENAVGIMNDKLEYVRWERATRMIDKVNEHLEKRGLEKVRPIPPKFAMPMIESASWEEDDELQDIWCRLIVNGLDANFQTEIRYAYIDIIKNLTSMDARILKFVYDSALSTYFDRHPIHYKYDHIKETGIFTSTVMEKLNAEPYQVYASIDNLYRVGCIQNNTLKDSIKEMSTSLKPPRVFDNISLTQLGIIFVEACLNE